MSVISRFSAIFTSVSEFYKDINPSTLSGAIDILVVEQDDGSMACSPFHVRFGKLQLLRAQERVVTVNVNGVDVDLQMKVGDAGEAFFVVGSEENVPVHLRTSPILVRRGSQEKFKDSAEPPLFPRDDSFIFQTTPPDMSDSPSRGMASDSEVEYNDPVTRPGKLWKWSKIPKTDISDSEILKKYNIVDSPSHVYMSVCGFKHDLTLAEFAENLVSFDQFLSDPSIASSPSLVFRINGQFQTYESAKATILSLAVFKRELIQDISKDDKKKSRWRTWWSRDDQSNDKNLVKTENMVKKTENMVKTENIVKTENMEKYFTKALRLNSNQLRSLGLKPGSNIVKFSVHSSLQGQAMCTSRIFLWKADEKVVISDIDGTITKSDALGHFFTMVGRDWTHSGVASLYTGIRRNGYQILYLSSRAIGQAQYTRNYLNKVEQGQFQLPDGPVFLSPDRLITAITREVILRRPEEFKIACLKDIQSLFAENPFYAGFGNRSTDAFSYRAVGVPVSRIFNINPKGEVRRELLEGYRASYVQLRELVDHIFPPVCSNSNTQFNDFNFWRIDPPLATDSDDSQDCNVSEDSIINESEAK